MLPHALCYVVPRPFMRGTRSARSDDRCKKAKGGNPAIAAAGCCVHPAAIGRSTDRASRTAVAGRSAAAADAAAAGVSRGSSRCGQPVVGATAAASTGTSSQAYDSGTSSCPSSLPASFGLSDDEPASPVVACSISSRWQCSSGGTYLGHMRCPAAVRTGAPMCPHTGTRRPTAVRAGHRCAVAVALALRESSCIWTKLRNVQSAHCTAWTVHA